MVIQRNISVRNEKLMDIRINGRSMFVHTIMKIFPCMLVRYSFVFMRPIPIMFEVKSRECFPRNSSGCLVVTQAPFEVEESGWGEFEIQVTIYFADQNEKPVGILDEKSLHIVDRLGDILSSFKTILHRSGSRCWKQRTGQ